MSSEDYKKAIEDVKLSSLVQRSTEEFKNMQQKAKGGDAAAKREYIWGVAELRKQVKDQNAFSGAILTSIGEKLDGEEFAVNLPGGLEKLRNIEEEKK